MNSNLNGYIDRSSVNTNASNQRMFIVGGAIAGLNLTLMTFVCLYWTNPEFHVLLTGKPL